MKQWHEQHFHSWISTGGLPSSIARFYGTAQVPGKVVLQDMMEKGEIETQEFRPPPQKPKMLLYVLPKMINLRTPSIADITD